MRYFERGQTRHKYLFVWSEVETSKARYSFGRRSKRVGSLIYRANCSGDFPRSYATWPFTHKDNDEIQKQIDENETRFFIFFLEHILQFQMAWFSFFKEEK